MTTYANKSQPFFLGSSDEKSLEEKLNLQFGDIMFIDGVKWPSCSPPAKRISECKSPIIYIWNRRLTPNLPFKQLEGGLAQGPSSGVVVQLLRSCWRDGVLYSGEAGIGYDVADNGMELFVKGCWKVFKALNAATLDGYKPSTDKTLDTNISSYIVGEHAKHMALTGTALRHCSADVFYRIHAPVINGARGKGTGRIDK
jgi:hypothetical protein